jgi:hypothetical protein
MGATLKVLDQHLGASAAQRSAGVNLRLASERITAREIIRSRVEAEVHEANQARRLQAEREAAARSHMVLTEAEQRLNTVPSKGWNWVKSLDIEAEVDRATAAFVKRQFVMLLDERQIDDLDAAIGLRPASEVVFVYLTPLKGG